jgi:hypothetical protein
MVSPRTVIVYALKRATTIYICLNAGGAAKYLGSIGLASIAQKWYRGFKTGLRLPFEC